jgi:uncharacterized delta-60 repeat protein
VKNLLIILSIILLSSPLFGQSNTKQWTKQLGTTSNDSGEGVTTDSSGNIYVTGITQGLDGDTEELGLYDIILMKFDLSGKKQWTKQLVTSNRLFDQGSSLFFDSSGNIYVTGWTGGGLDGNTSSGGHDIFLIKFNSSGTKQWTEQLGTSSLEIGLGVTTDSSGNIYVTGYTKGGGLDGNTNFGGYDIFLVKFNSSGIKQWTKQLGTSSKEFGHGVTNDSSGNIYVTGFTQGGLDGNTNSGGKDIFLVKYNSSGTKIWTKQLGTSKDEDGYQVTTDSTGHIYMTGYTDGDLDGNTSSGGRDIFLIKFNSSGTKIWTKQLGTSKNDEGYEVTIDSSGNIYVTGWTGGGLDGNTNMGGYDIFLIKFNSSGTKQWTEQLGTSSSDIVLGLTTDSTGHIYMTGFTRGGLDGNTNSGGKDIFLVKYNSDGVKQ